MFYCSVHVHMGKIKSQSTVIKLYVPVTKIENAKWRTTYFFCAINQFSMKYFVENSLAKWYPVWPKSSLCPFTLQTVCPTVTGFPRLWNRLQGCHIPSVNLVYHSHYRQYNCWLLAFGEMPRSFNYCLRFVCDLVTQWQNIHLHPLALCCRITLKDKGVTTLHTPSVTIARNSVHVRFRLRMLMVPSSETEI